MNSAVVSANNNLENTAANLKVLDESKFNSQPQQPVVDLPPSSTSTTLPIDNLMNSQNNTTSFIKPVESKIENTDDLLNAVPKPDMMISSPAESSISTDDLLEDYVGNNYEKLINKKINFSAFFFTTFYMIYRKMVLPGILIYLCEMILVYLTIIYKPMLIMVSLGINFIVSLVLLFLFNSMYIKNAKSKIDKIKRKNKVISVSELRKLCAKKGGTSIVVAIVTSLIISIVFTTTFNTLFPIDSEELKNNLFKSFSNTSSNNNDKDDSSDNNEEKNNKEKIDLENLKYVDDISLEDKLSMQYLLIFTQTDTSSNSKYEYTILTKESDNNSYCKFTLGITKDYNDSKKLLNDLSKYYKVNDIEDINAKTGLTWQNFLRENNDEKIYYASINNNDDTYLFEYKIGSTASENLCKAYYNGIINSIQFK